jgi:hypothetical protein
MGCDNKESCPALQAPEKSCWQVASELDDYRSAFKICQDCIVFMLKNNESSLSEQEVHTIMERKVACVLA